MVCRATLQRLAEREAVRGAPSCPVGLTAQHTHVARPDKRPECKAQIGLCQSNSLWSSVNVKLMQHKTRGHLALNPTSKRTQGGKGFFHPLMQRAAAAPVLATLLCLRCGSWSCMNMLCCASCALLCLLSCMVQTSTGCNACMCYTLCRHNIVGFLLQVKEIWTGATSRYELALRQVQQAIDMAEEQMAGQTVVRSIFSMHMTVQIPASIQRTCALHCSRMSE